MQIGDQVQVVDGNHQLYQAEIIDLADLVTVQLGDRLDIETELPVQVAVFSGLAKGDKFEWLVQKLTELGVYEFYPVAMRYSVAKWEPKKADKKVSRLQKIMQAAAEQSKRLVVPVCQPLHTFDQALSQLANYDYVIVAYEESAKQGERSQLAQLLNQVKPGERLALIFGPEGGLAPHEIEVLSQLENCYLVGLGPRIMRTETAPLYALACISYVCELN